MRFKITLSLAKVPSYLSYNYQYELSGWIYKVLKNADEEYSDFLHNQGYINETKIFKLFSFSHLHFQKFQKQEQGFRIESREISFQIGFYMEKGTETFILGLFRDQIGSIGNKTFQMDFKVSNVEMINFEITDTKINLKTLSPLVIAKKTERGKEYLSPEHEDYEGLFMQNLLEKYKSTGKSIPLSWQNFPFKLTILGEKLPVSKLITIKAESEAETKVRGFLFDFELIAPIEIIELGIMAGFGTENAMGFGCCNLIFD
ncbi:MAG: CRISPR-associated endoribonuclease Cas6 [Bacteroidetes bacterium]|nr:MAG: CRISPR-associated endoribonuclease Cas6 [Bacteroidota bacterium]TAG86756.1 MAG: CRISPR-associated endoribonuclease Cas6 [Bacteroidota bacterium]